MATIALEPFRDRDSGHYYTFDTDARTYESIVHGADRPRELGIRGSAELRTVGVLKRREVFVAEFAWRGELWVAIPPHVFIWPGPHVARRSALGPVKRFSVKEDNSKALTLSYLWWDGGKWNREAFDIFAHIAMTTASRAAFHRAIYWNEARAGGEDVHTAEFDSRLKQYLDDK